MNLRSGKVVHDHGGIVLIQGDSTKVLPIDGQEVHLVVTSPPYIAGMDGDLYPDLPTYREAMRTVMRGCYEMLVDGGMIIWNILNHKGMNLISKASEDLEEVGFSFWRSITWVKGDNQGAGFQHTMVRPYALNWIPNCISEGILMYVKGTKRPYDSDHKINLALAKQFRTDVWHIMPVVKIGAGGENRLGHDSPFPRKIPINCIEFFTSPGEIVLDPFVGSGTTLYAAAQVDPARRAIGIEILDKHIVTCCRELTSKSYTLFAYQMTQGE
jgi:site-specific DNA-methyltransferase (adenine-specific)